MNGSTSSSSISPGASSSSALDQPILQLRIKEVWGDRIRKSWSDRRKHKLEDVLNEVIAGVIVVADAKERHRLDLERQQREWAEAEQRRVELEQQHRAEEQRLKELE